MFFRGLQGFKRGLSGQRVLGGLIGPVPLKGGGGTIAITWFGV